MTANHKSRSLSVMTTRAAKQSGVKGFGEIAKVERDSMSRDRDRGHLITLSARASTFCGTAPERGGQRG